MPTSTELIEELVTLTQGSLQNVQTELAELRADVRVLSERVNNRHEGVERLEREFAEHRNLISGELKALEDRMKALEQAHAKYLGAAGVIGAVVGFLASVAKGFLGL